MHKFLVVGAGFSGAVIARELAEKCGAKIDIIDSRNHIGGNCFTEKDPATAVMVHKYGPHIFNTDSTKVWNYIQKFGEMRHFLNRVKAYTADGLHTLPINLQTINQVFKQRLGPAEAQQFLQQQCTRLGKEPRNFEEQALSMVGKRLYELFFKGYTKKQWGCDPCELPASILKRIPVRFNYDDNYYQTRYQGIPVEGYTKIIQNIVTHPNISISLNTKFNTGIEKNYDHLFFTGSLDGFFSFRHGRLRYRTVTFERIDSNYDIQGNAVINYTEEAVPYTRIHEHKHFTPWEKLDKSVAFKEFSKETTEGIDPFYPLRLEDDLAKLRKYYDDVKCLDRITFLGRLGTYRYLDMDDVIDEALSCAERICSNKKLLDLAGFSYNPF